MPADINPMLANLGVPTLNVPKPHNPAQWMYERLVRSIIDFEKEMSANEELGARLVSFGNTEIIHVLDVGYWGPDLIRFYGVNADNRPVQLLQHITQISMLLVALPVQKGEPRRIGFHLEQKLKPET